MTSYETMPSPVGELLLAGEQARDGLALTSVSMTGQRNAPRPQAGWRHHPEAFADVTRQLQAYFTGELPPFTPPAAPRSSSGSGGPGTPFGTAPRSPTASGPRSSASRRTGSWPSAPRSART